MQNKTIFISLELDATLRLEVHLSKIRVSFIETESARTIYLDL